MSYSKIRHIQNVNLLSETRFLNSKSLLMEGDDNTYITQNDQVLYNEKGEEEIEVPKGTKFTRSEGDKAKTKLNGSDFTFFCATTKKKDKIPLRFESKGKYYYSFDLQKKLVSVFCDSKSTNFQGCIKGDCANGYGEFKDSEDGSTYKGNWKDGKKNGYGEVKWDGGGDYKGNWKDGEENGYGVKTWSDGSIYNGNWEEGTWGGKGTYTNPSGCKFYGEWDNNRLNGNNYEYYDKITDCPENNQPTNNNDDNQNSNGPIIGGVDNYFKGKPVDDKDPFEYLKIERADGSEEYWFRGVKDKDNYKALTKYPNWRRAKNRIGLDAIKNQINFDERMTDVPENWENRVQN